MEDELSLAAVYDRTVAASLERVWENVHDWEHRPFLHARAFADIELEEAGDPELVAEMDRVREVCSAALGLRATENARVRQPLAGDVVGRAVVDGRSNDRETEGHVDGLTKPRQFDRNQPLIVVAGNDGVVVTVHRAPEHSIGRQGTGNVDSTSAHCFDSRSEHALIFLTDDTGLTGVRI